MFTAIGAQRPASWASEAPPASPGPQGSADAACIMSLLSWAEAASLDLGPRTAPPKNMPGTRHKTCVRFAAIPQAISSFAVRADDALGARITRARGGPPFPKGRTHKKGPLHFIAWV